MNPKNKIEKQMAYTEHMFFDEMSALNNQLINIQRELQKKNAELEKANELKNQYLGMVVHDLRNPLATILAFNQALISESISEKQVRLLNLIGTSAEFMLNLVDELLDMSKIEAGKLELNLENVDIAELIEGNVAINNIIAQNNKVRLSSYIQENLPQIAVDTNKLQQVLNNLVSNAIKFSNPGGSVEVKVYLEEENIVIAVIDHGQGIPEEELGLLFRPFSVTSVKSMHGEKNTGLGLAIAKKIVEGHNGKIKVQSKSGEGSCFFVYLPLFKTAFINDNNCCNRIYEDIGLKPLRILVVEDDFVNSVALNELLESNGLTSLIAKSGNKALELLETTNVDLVFLDIEMPDMNGIDVCKRIREMDQRRRKHTCVIGLSAHPVELYKDKCIDAGMDDYIRKPITKKVINETVRRLFHGEKDLKDSIMETAAANEYCYDKEIYEAFFSEYSEKRDRLGNAISELNYQEIKKLSHTLKGGLSYLGAKTAVKTAQDMEECTGDGECLKKLFQKLIYEIEHIKDYYFMNLEK